MPSWPIRDTVIDGDRVEFLGDAAGSFNLAGDQLPRGPSGGRAGNKLGKAIHHSDDRLAEVRNPSFQ